MSPAIGTPVAPKLGAAEGGMDGIPIGSEVGCPGEGLALGPTAGYEGLIDGILDGRGVGSPGSIVGRPVGAVDGSVKETTVGLGVG